MKELRLFLAFIALFAVSHANTEALARMKDRVPQIDALKLSEKLGENNLGYLAAPPSGKTLAPAENSLMQSENADRELVYADIAQRNGVTAREVGQQRALALSQRSVAGVWTQDTSGNWAKK